MSARRHEPVQPVVVDVAAAQLGAVEQADSRNERFVVPLVDDDDGTGQRPAQAGERLGTGRGPTR